MKLSFDGERKHQSGPYRSWPSGVEAVTPLGREPAIIRIRPVIRISGKLELGYWNFFGPCFRASLPPRKFLHSARDLIYKYEYAH